jgi:hypothetical protein
VAGETDSAVQSPTPQQEPAKGAQAHSPARQILPEDEQEKLRREGSRPGPGSKRLGRTPFDENTSPREVLERADGFYREGKGGRPSVLYVNGQGRWLLEMADALLISGEPSPIGGLTLAPADITDYTSALHQIADGVEADPSFSATGAEAARRIAAKLQLAIAADSPVILIPLDGRPLGVIKTSRRHEGIHRELSKVDGGTKTTDILADSGGFLDSSDPARQAAQVLRNLGTKSTNWQTKSSCASGAANGQRSI